MGAQLGACAVQMVSEGLPISGSIGTGLMVRDAPFGAPHHEEQMPHPEEPRSGVSKGKPESANYMPMAAALLSSASAWRMEAMSISRPSRDTAPLPSLAACFMAATMRLALVTSASDGVNTL